MRGEPATIRTLLDRLLAARARRDREVRFSAPWRAADNVMRELEVAIFRLPLERPRRITNGPLRGRATVRAD
jgi:hypothetical protein